MANGNGTPRIPVDGRTLDFNALYIGKGMSFNDIYALSARSGIPVEWSDRESFIKKTPGLDQYIQKNPQEFNKLWVNSEQAFIAYKSNQFEQDPYYDWGGLRYPLVDRIGNYPIAVHMTTPHKAGETTNLGMEGVPNVGFLKTVTEDQSSASVGAYLDKNDIWRPLTQSKFADNYLTWEKGDPNQGQPEYFYRELKDGEDRKSTR